MAAVEMEQLRMEAEQLKNRIRVCDFAHYFFF